MPENTNPTAAEISAQEVTQSANATENAQQTQQAQPARPERTFTQADVDRMIQDRLSRERRQHQQDIENARSEARTEAERLAQMTQEQRLQEEAQRREQQLRQREADIVRRELRATAIDTLQRKAGPLRA